MLNTYSYLGEAKFTTIHVEVVIYLIFISNPSHTYKPTKTKVFSYL